MSAINPIASFTQTDAAGSVAETGPKTIKPGGTCPFKAHKVPKVELNAIRAVVKLELLASNVDHGCLHHAVKALGRALQLDPADAKGKTHLLLAQAETRLGHWTEGAKACEAALQRVPGNKEATKLLARCQANMTTVASPVSDAFSPRQS